MGEREGMRGKNSEPKEKRREGTRPEGGSRRKQEERKSNRIKMEKAEGETK